MFLNYTTSDYLTLSTIKSLAFRKTDLKSSCFFSSFLVLTNEGAAFLFCIYVTLYPFKLTKVFLLKKLQFHNLFYQLF